MIGAYTGLPGSGKTLKMITDVILPAKAEGRPVYVHGIDGLSEELGCIALDNPQDWHKVPAGSIVCLDEAQKVFRQRPPGSPVPEWVSAGETHRHLGIDLYITTQSPMLIDSHLRRLVGLHCHLVRVWGLQASTVYQWDELQPDPQDRRSRQFSQKSRFRFPKKNFGLYKSAEVHTHKRHIPRWLAPLLLGIVAAFFGAYYLGRHALSSLTSARAALHPTTVSPVGVSGSSAVDGPGVSAPVVRPSAVAHVIPVSSRWTVRGRVSGAGRGLEYVLVGPGGRYALVSGRHCYSYEGARRCRFDGRVVEWLPGSG